MSLIARQSLVGVLALILCATAVSAQRRRGPGAWELLAERSVTDRADHDTIVVTAARGNFRSIRLDVMGHAVDFQRVVVHFRAGDDQVIQLRNTIRAGESSRVIDLEGADRVIRSVDFWYDASTLGAGGKAVVRLMGRN